VPERALAALNSWSDLRSALLEGIESLDRGEGFPQKRSIMNFGNSPMPMPISLSKRHHEIVVSLPWLANICWKQRRIFSSEIEFKPSVSRND